MKDKTRNNLCQAINSVILAGLLLFFIGLYYWVIKAGIPYQDPTLELQIQYAVNMGIGNILVRSGFVVAICGGIIRLLVEMICRKHHR